MHARHARRAPSNRVRRRRLAAAALGTVLVVATTVGSVVASSAGRTASSTTATSTPTTPTTPTTERPAPPDPLGPAVTRLLASRRGTVVAAVQDLSTGAVWVTGRRAAEDEASVVKLDVLEALLHRRGARLSAVLRSEATTMIEQSDNAAATALWDGDGGTRGIESFDAAVGLTATTPSSCVTCAGFPWPGWGLTTTTPLDQLRLLRLLVVPNPILGPTARRFALGLMEHVTPSERWGVTGGVGPGATVALKDGWLPLDASGTDWQINSVGWVDGDGRDYLVAVLSTGDPTEAYGITTIDAVAALVWAGLAPA